MKPRLVISCPSTSRSGYGDHSRDLIRSLIDMNKFDIHVYDVYPDALLASSFITRNSFISFNFKFF